MTTSPPPTYGADEKWYSVPEVARALALSEVQVRRLIRIGELRGERYFGRITVAESAIRTYRRGAAR